MLFSNVFAEYIPQNVAENVAKNFLYENTGKLQNTFIFDEIITKSNLGLELFYVLNYENGFVIVSADDNAPPILGYSTNNRFYGGDLPPQMTSWLQNYARQIYFIIENNILGEQLTKNQWKKYNCKPQNFIATKSSKEVLPLLGTIAWHQNADWNSFCPIDGAGPGGHVYAGCVATAIGQIMKYWEFPSSGTGSHSYTDDLYGEQSADFESTNYNWEAMSNTAATDETAKLLYHIGVALEMDYGINGSSTNTSDGQYILRAYFKYKSSTTYIRKFNYSEAEWADVMKNQLDNNRPILYRGDNDDGSGHAFVLDGYDDNNFFHFNWGWAGSLNGYFLLSSLTPGTHDFSYGQSAVINIEPDFTEPTSLFANVSNQNVVLTWKQPLYWQRYASLYNTSNVNWQGPERAVLYDNEDFNFSYPATITAVSHAFYEHSDHPWPDATFHFSIYSVDGTTLLYESGDLEARHKEEIYHKLSTPIEVNDDFYVAIVPTDESGHPSSYSLAVPIGTTHSYKGSAGSWETYTGSTSDYEFVAGVYIAGSGLLKSNNTKEVVGYMVFRDDIAVSSTLSNSTFNFFDNDLSAGDYTYCVKAVYDDGSSECSDEVNVTVLPAIIDDNSIKISIYPNPATNFVVVNINEPNSYLQIIDITGKVVDSKFLNQNQNIIDVSRLQKGIYMFKIQSNWFQKTYKVPKN